LAEIMSAKMPPAPLSAARPTGFVSPAGAVTGIGLARVAAAGMGVAGSFCRRAGRRLLRLGVRQLPRKHRANTGIISFVLKMLIKFCG
jgi:hypothetical protein